MPLSDKLKSFTNDQQQAKPGLWRGPEKDGITFSMLSRFLVCRERFRLYAVEGLRPAPSFNHRIEYGQMWHVCEEMYAACPGDKHPNKPHESYGWEYALAEYAKGLCKKYPFQQEQVDHWYNVCKTQFPHYVEYWQRHTSEAQVTPLLQEQVFDVPYTIPSGRVVRLRGKWDGVNLITTGEVRCPKCGGDGQFYIPPRYEDSPCGECKGTGRVTSGGIWLFETKTKGDIDEQQLQRQLNFDLQTMLYLVALSQDTAIDRLEGVKGWRGPQKGFKMPIQGVRYNVVRRPLSGGKGTIVRHKSSKNRPEESKESFYNRLGEYIKDAPETYFMRWDVLVTPADVLRFRKECLDPILEQLYDWWEYVKARDPFRYEFDGDLSYPVPHGLHWRHPFGVFNPIDGGYGSDLDNYLATGSRAGLVKVDSLFTELQ